MKNKNIIALFLVSVLFFSLSIPTTAAESSTIHLEPFNEYDYIESLKNCSSQDLKVLGINKQEATIIISKYESALIERSVLSDSELKAYGYNDSEIALFRDFANGKELSSAELQSLGSTCNGAITRHSCSNKSAEFSYTFTWERCPLITLSDSAAMRWIVYDEAGNEIGVEQTSSPTLIEYHFQGNAASDGKPAFAHYGLATQQSNLDFNTLNMQFPVYQTHSSPNGIISDCYAKTGTVKVTVNVPASTPQNIHHIFVGGLYGHTLVGIGSPSVTVSSGSIGISFTGNTSIDPIASRKATIYRDSTKVEYWG